MKRHHLVLIASFCLACVTPSGEPSPSPASNPSPATPEPAMTTPTTLALHPELARYVASIEAELATIPAERKQALDQIAKFVVAERSAGRTAKLVFICTHNSRRSHMSQVWATTAAAVHGLSGIESYSGGTEATAFNPRAIAALQRAGFAIPTPEAADNPHYQIGYAADQPSLEAFSKVYSDPSNPQAEFAAIMTCSEADESCPFVPGATARISLAYDDPKVADNTPDEQARYDERCRQIAREMFYLFGQVREQVRG